MSVIRSTKLHAYVVYWAWNHFRWLFHCSETIQLSGFVICDLPLPVILWMVECWLCCNVLWDVIHLLLSFDLSKKPVALNTLQVKGWYLIKWGLKLTLWGKLLSCLDPTMGWSTGWPALSSKKSYVVVVARTQQQAAQSSAVCLARDIHPPIHESYEPRFFRLAHIVILAGREYEYVCV